MSAHYSLRTRPSHAGVATQPGMVRIPKKVTDVLGSQIQPGLASSAAPMAHASDNGLTEGVTRSYSDVVASHPSSPVSVTEGEAPSGEIEALAHSARVEETLVNTTEVISPHNTKNIVQTDSESHEGDTSSLSEISEADNKNPWTTVVHRRSRSLDSLKKDTKTAKKVKVVQNRVNKLTTEQDTVINQAEKQLTIAQKEQLSHRYEKVQKHAIPCERSESRGEGPSTSKGKGTDPHNWGNAQLSDSDLDVDAQRVAFESFAKNHDKDLIRPVSPHEENPQKTRVAHQGKRKPLKAPSGLVFGRASECPAPKTDKQRRARLEKAARTNEPINQISPKSYLGHALDNIDKPRKASRCHGQKHSSSGSSSSPSSSDSESLTSLSSSSSESSDSDDELSDGSINSRRARRRPRHRSNCRDKQRHKSRSKKSKTLIRPIPPVEYDGAADARAYHRFVTEGTDYVTSGKVHRERHAFVLSYYLKGKAYDFYTQNVSLNPHEWTLREFFIQLFNYCFPSDYRTEL
jgi:hypothetical protein